MAKGKNPGKGRSGYLWLIVLGLITIGAVTAVAISAWGSAEQEIPGLQTFTSEGNSHVATGSPVTYKTDPPTSGPHYGSTLDAGFYTKPQAAGEVVHALEHGMVVIYYDPSDAPAGLAETLRGYAMKHNGHWDGVIVIPREQPEEVILTAWGKMLKLQKWDKDLAERFMDAFRGRGPENPVR